MKVEVIWGKELSEGGLLEGAIVTLSQLPSDLQTVLSWQDVTEVTVLWKDGRFNKYRRQE